MDGTDLSMAYASMYEPEPTFARPAPPPQVPVLDVPKATASHAQPPEVPYSPPTAMYTQQSPRADPVYVAEPSFMDRLASKKADVMKLVALSLVVLLGISSDRMISHYLSGYISKSFLTDMQELLVRLAYPVGVIIVLWILKTVA